MSIIELQFLYLGGRNKNVYFLVCSEDLVSGIQRERDAETHGQEPGISS